MAQHEATPALIPIWIPCWGSRAHRGGNTEAVCMSGGIIQWDSTAREGTHLNQPQVVVGEHRRAEPRPQPLGREGNPSCTGWPHWQGQRIFSSKRTTGFPSAAELEEAFLSKANSACSEKVQAWCRIACVTGMLMGLCVHSGLPAMFQRGEICRKAGI